MNRLKARFWNQIGAMYRFIGLRRGRRGAFLSAERAFTRAIRLDEEYHDARFNRGLLYWRELAEYDLATADFSAVLDFFPEAIFMRGMAFEAKGDYHAAADDLHDFIAGHPQSHWIANAMRQLRAIEAILDDIEARSVFLP